MAKYLHCDCGDACLSFQSDRKIDRHGPFHVLWHLFQLNIYSWDTLPPSLYLRVFLLENRTQTRISSTIIETNADKENPVWNRENIAN